MNNITIAFLLTFLAGFSTMLGCFVIFFKQRDSIALFSLGFSFSVMLSISIFSLIPEALFYLSGDFFVCFVFLIIGMFISYFLEKISSTKTNGDGLYKLGILVFLAIIIHNIPEGIISFFVTNKSIGLGISLSIAIMLHNIPEGISISLPIFYSNGSKKKALLYTFIASISEPFGALIAFLLLPTLNNYVMGIIFSITAGIMFHISITEILPESLKYRNYKLTSISVILGFIVVLFTIFL